MTQNSERGMMQNSEHGMMQNSEHGMMQNSERGMQSVFWHNAVNRAITNNEENKQRGQI